MVYTETVQSPIDGYSDFSITSHAWKRMCTRRISMGALESVIQYGRIFYTRGAKIYAIGRKEVEKFRQQQDLSSYEGIQIVCSHSGSILTVYKNQDFRKLRPCRRKKK